MSATAVGVKKNRVRLRQHLRRRPRGAEIGRRLDRQPAGIEAFFQQQHAGIVLVLARSVRGATGQEQKLFFRRIRGKAGRDREGEGGEQGEDFHG